MLRRVPKGEIGHGNGIEGRKNQKEKEKNESQKLGLFRMTVARLNGLIQGNKRHSHKDNSDNIHVGWKCEEADGLRKTASGSQKNPFNLDPSSKYTPVLVLL